jgi:hypothetical protein
MSSVRRPDHAGPVALGVARAQRTDPELDAVPANLPPEPSALQARPSHLVPCGQCGALNGRSALLCWACEADLLALAPFAAAAPPEPVLVPVVVQQQTVVESDGTADGQRGLHLVSRVGAPVSVQAAANPPGPDPTVELPVLTTQVEAPEPLPFEVKARQPYPAPMIALACAGVLLLVVAAGLRWWGAPAAVASPPLAGAALERPFAAPAQGSAPDAASLSFPPREVAPDDASLDRTAAAPERAKAVTPARATAKAREPRTAAARAPIVLLPSVPPARQRGAAPATCTANMAALGFCTLEPASAKE